MWTGVLSEFPGITPGKCGQAYFGDHAWMVLELLHVEAD
jgi:hypothetical protein